MSTFVAGSASYAIETLGNGNDFSFGNMAIMGTSTALQGALGFSFGKIFNIGEEADLVTKLTKSYLSKVYAGHLGFVVDLLANCAIGQPWIRKDFIDNYLPVWLS